MTAFIGGLLVGPFVGFGWVSARHAESTLPALNRTDGELCSETVVAR